MKQPVEICMLGAGNVATHLARALHDCGYIIKGVMSRTMAHAQELASSVDCPMATDSAKLLPEADVYIFSVKDDALPHLAQEIATCHPSCNSLMVHTAGSMPLSILSEHFSNAAVLYPMQTFSRNKAVNVSEVPFFIEGSNDEALRSISNIACHLSKHVTPLDTARRRILHLSAVFASNFSNHCYALAFQLLKEANINPQCLLPLIDETARKVHSISPQQAQTGPAVRWDEGVMASQAQLLASQPQLQQIYQLLSASIHHLHADSNS